MTLIQGYRHMRTGDTLIVLKNKKPKLIPSHKWWIDRNTPVGEDADLWEIKPHGGRARVMFEQVIGLIRQ